MQRRFCASALCATLNVGISFKRGRPNANGQYTLDDPFSVLDNIPGTPKYWQKRKWEMIARLENLGAFQIFFTLIMIYNFS